jgi:flagellar motor switch protein FliN/FliY
VSKTQVQNVKVELTVIVGRSTLPMHQLLRMGRGAVIPLDVRIDDEVWILANGHPIARGEITLNGDRMAVTITSPANYHDFIAIKAA